MLPPLLAGLPVLLLCLALQASFVGLCLRWHARFRRTHADGATGTSMRVLSAAMLLMLLCNFLQVGIWAVLFFLLGEFAHFSEALYHSAVNFSTLGYGDVVMSHRWRLLGPLEAANGILMFGVSTAVMTGAVVDILKYNDPRQERDGR